MSAYIVDPRTIDYLVAWIERGRPSRTVRTRKVWLCWDDVPEEYEHAQSGSDPFGYGLELMKLDKNELGRILLQANVRSVAHRYGNTAPEDLPGPVNQKRIWSYRFRPIRAELNPAWVIKCADCLRYQSCETPDYPRSLAEAITEAIREDAIRALTEDAPWGVTDADLQGAPRIA